MTAKERREQMMRRLASSRQPVSASVLAAEFGVSRQAVVGDIALLRAGGADISATPRGYLCRTEALPGILRTIACRHRREDLAEELYAVVDNGGGLLDVIVEHPVYGQISGQLQVFSRYDADAFLSRVEQEQAIPLSGLTNGIHLHTIQCRDEAAYQRILEALSRRGFLLDPPG